MKAAFILIALAAISGVLGSRLSRNELMEVDIDNERPMTFNEHAILFELNAYNAGKLNGGLSEHTSLWLDAQFEAELRQFAEDNHFPKTYEEAVEFRFRMTGNRGIWSSLKRAAKAVVVELKLSAVQLRKPVNGSSIKQKVCGRNISVHSVRKSSERLSILLKIRVLKVHVNGLPKLYALSLPLCVVPSVSSVKRSRVPSLRHSSIKDV